jgi:uncharacterized protein YaiI (UPF0178 family)/uncharacterized damage-inducible protein DinB
LLHIYVDADACAVKEEIYRVARRYELEVTLVTNSRMRIPEDPRITLKVVNEGFDAADDWIVAEVTPGDIVITADIPLASRCLKKGARVLGSTGKPFTEENIGDVVATRDLMAGLRGAGEITGGPPPLGQKDRSRFLEQLDQMIQSIRRAPPARRERRAPLYTPEALLDLHERAHRSLAALLTHCREFNSEEIDRELPGFGYPTVRLQLHHEIGAEKYWIGVLQGRIDAEEDAPDYPTIESLVAYRKQVFAVTEGYLRTASVEELNAPRPMMTWGNREKVLTPAHVFMRTMTHIYHHQGQVTAMCRLLGRPVNGLDYPIT